MDEVHCVAVVQLPPGVMGIAGRMVRCQAAPSDHHRAMVEGVEIPSKRPVRIALRWPVYGDGVMEDEPA